MVVDFHQELSTRGRAAHPASELANGDDRSTLPLPRNVHMNCWQSKIEKAGKPTIFLTSHG